MKFVSSLLVIAGLIFFGLALFVKSDMYDGFPENIVHDLKSGIHDESTSGVEFKVRPWKDLVVLLYVLSIAFIILGVYLTFEHKKLEEKVVNIKEKKTTGQP